MARAGALAYRIHHRIDNGCIGDERWIDPLTNPDYSADSYAPLIDDGPPVYDRTRATCTRTLALVDGQVVASYTVTQRPVTADDVRAEASRRMQALVGARDADHLAIIISNGTREAVDLQNRRLISGTPWTVAETRRAAELKRMSGAIDAIRAASNAIEGNPPADYDNDGYWPAFAAETDAEVRIIATEAIQQAARFVRERLVSGQVFYEVAVQARNGNADAIAKLEDPAAARGVSVSTLVDSIIAERVMVEQATTALDVIEVDALGQLTMATADEAWLILEQTILEINGG